MIGGEDFPRLGDQLIASELFDDELIVGKVGIDARKDIVSILPSPRAFGVLFAVAIAIGIPSDIEPMPSPMLTVAWVSQEPIDGPFVSIWAGVLDECLNLLLGRG